MSGMKPNKTDISYLCLTNPASNIFRNPFSGVKIVFKKEEPPIYRKSPYILSQIRNTFNSTLCYSHIASS